MFSDRAPQAAVRRGPRTSVSRLLLLAAVVSALGSFTLMACKLSRGGPKPAEMVTAAAQRGEYLVTALGCNDCHTPWILGPRGPEPDMPRMLSGHPDGETLSLPAAMPEGWGWLGSHSNTAYAGPWGISYAINLTPDELTGIGVWTEEIFIQTLRTGRHWGVARPILPPMPWQAYRHLSDEDLKAIFAYLRSIPALHNQVPESQPAPELLAADAQHGPAS